jgi:hypothetical protein
MTLLGMVGYVVGGSTVVGALVTYNELEKGG